MKDKKYEYVGNCRCGLGPHALYKDNEGNLYHASEVPSNLKEGSLERQIKPLPDRAFIGTGIGPCGNGIPRGGGRGYHGGWRQKSSLQEVK
jgi:hypothetical protein